MNNKNYSTYGCFKYVSNVSEKDDFKLGDIVINCIREIGIIIQVHSPNEFRVDMFGNACTDEIRLATDEEIEKDCFFTETSVGKFTENI